MASILIIEDEPTVLVLAESVLGHAGFETFSAASLAQAQAILHSEHKIDLIFTDIVLADHPEGGLQVGQVARHVAPDTPVLYASGAALTDGMKALFVWPYDFLPKPYTDRQLIEAVERLLKKARNQSSPPGDRST